MSIQQAIFTSAQTKRASGYHLACRSSGLSEADARELTAWGPSHDSLADSTPAAQSVNFFPLSSGSFCVSRTVIAGQEYSGRGGWRVFTTCLVISPADLSRFANNPFAIIRAALAAGELDPPAVLPQSLEPLSLGGRAAGVDHTILYRLSARVSADEIVRLITAVFKQRHVVVGAAVDGELLVAGVLNSLPVDRRPELSFSTGLRFCSQRPFRLTVLPHHAESELRHAALAGAKIHRMNAGQFAAQPAC